MSQHITMKNLPESERPYEKFMRYGAGKLSDAELLAVILKTGRTGENSVDVARKLLQGKHNNLLNLYDISFQDLMKIPGIGRVKAIQLKAVAELSRRIAKTQSGYQLQLGNPKTIADYYMEQLRHHKEEVLMCAFFDAKCKFLGETQISKGSVNFAYVSPRDVFLQALTYEAVLIVLIHNHPSGDPTPSDDDCNITSRIRRGGQLLGLELVDHIIIGDNIYYSFHENQQI